MKRNTRVWSWICGILVGGLVGLMMMPPVYASPAAQRPGLSAVDTIETDASEILLGQIVTIDSAPAELKARLAGIRIGRAAPAGQARKISRDYILLRLRQSGFDPARFDIRLPSKITVRRTAVIFT